MLNASNALARILKQEGTEYLFCFPTTEMIEAAAAEGIRVITCRTERTVINMADGYSRILNGKRIGVCAVQHGAGIENAFVGVAQAYADSTPVLVLCDGPTLDRQGLPALFDPVENYRGITKWAETINKAERIPEMATRAFTKLRNGRRRPILLELPKDVAQQKLDETSLAYQPTRSFLSAGDPRDVTEAVRLLKGAERPMVYAGQGVLWGEAGGELVELAELMQLPVMTTLFAKSAFPEDHPLALGIGGYTLTGAVHHFLNAADVVLCMGASQTHTLAAMAIPPGKTVIHCTSDVGDVNTEYRTRHAIVGDARLVLRQLIDEARRQGPRADSPVEEIRLVQEQWLGQWLPKLRSDEVPINPYRIVWEVMASIDRANTIVTHDSGTPRAQLATFYRAPVPRSYLSWGNSHQLGSSLGLIMGAKLAAPDKLAVAFMGDAAFGMCGMDLETAVRERIAVLCIVLNNSAMATYPGLIPFATERYNVGSISGDYTMIAKGLGCHAERIDKPGDIAAGLRRAIKVTESGRPALLEFITRVEGMGPRLGALTPE